MIKKEKMKSFFFSLLIFSAILILSSEGLIADENMTENNPFLDEMIFDEDSMFGEIEETVVDSAEIVNNQEITDQMEERKSIGFSGELQSVSKYSLNRDYLKGDGKFSENGFENYVTGNFLLDIRLKNNIKGFANIEIDYYPNGIEETSKINLGTTEVETKTEIQTDYNLKEIFVDVNYDKKVYYRIGKQVLQWGRGYLWNPTDLINIDKKSFLSDAGAREGTFGLKAHIPQGAEKNYYFFVDTTGAENIDQFGGAAKMEFLVKDTEMAFSAWSKKGNNPVLGYDISSSIKDVSVIGEISLSDGANQKRLKVENGKLVEEIDEGVTPRVTVGFNKSFDYKEKNNRISVIGEFFYNHSGYDENVFKDKKVYATDVSVDELVVNPTTNVVTIVNKNLSLTKAQALLAGGYYEPNMHSKYYAAVFTSINEFLRNELTLNFNLITNLNDNSAIFSSGLAYADINDLKMSLNFNTYLGPDEAEYTSIGKGADLEFIIGINF